MYGFCDSILLETFVFVLVPKGGQEGEVQEKHKKERVQQHIICSKLYVNEEGYGRVVLSCVIAASGALSKFQHIKPKWFQRPQRTSKEKIQHKIYIKKITISFHNVVSQSKNKKKKHEPFVMNPVCR